MRNKDELLAGVKRWIDSNRCEVEKFSIVFPEGETCQREGSFKIRFDEKDGPYGYFCKRHYNYLYEEALIIR